MKRFFKLLTTFLASILCVVCCFSMAGCGEEMKSAQIKLQVYDYANNKFYSEADSTLTIDLYRHLAPKTVDAISAYLNEGYYNNAIFYQREVNSVRQVMVGDLFLNGNSLVVGSNGRPNISRKMDKPTLPGEFEHGGTVGSDLLNTKGAVGLWRDWYSYGDWTSSNSTATGSSTMYMLNEARTSFDGYFCVFGQIDFTISANSTAFDALNSVFSSSANYTEFVVFYTLPVVSGNAEDGYVFGEYDPSKKDCGLIFNIVEKEYFDSVYINLTSTGSEANDQKREDKEQELGMKIFIADNQKSQYNGYNRYTIRIPNNSKDGKFGAMIKSASVTDKD